MEWSVRAQKKFNGKKLEKFIIFDKNEEKLKE